VVQREGEREGPAESGRFIAAGRPGEGQLSKADFLESLQAKVFAAADGILAEIGQTAADCPYLLKWFSYYASQDAAHIERAIAKFAPESGEAGTLDAFMEAIVSRVETGLRNHVDTGSVDDVPEEIMEERPQPDDFEHIAEQANPTVQLSRLCSWCGSSGDNSSYDRLRDQRADSQDVELELPSSSTAKQKGKSHMISQGGTAIAQAGDTVHNLGTTSCGLVIAFGDEAIGCYHWPFMTDSESYFSTFGQVVEQVGTLRRIEIITNDYNNRKSEQEYLGTARKIRSTYGVPTAYYVHPGEIRGTDPSGTLEADHFRSSNDTEARSLDNERY
jgi:hypothetical protein